jgi:glycosyltransferase involved in cell wall biosynthesis
MSLKVYWIGYGGNSVFAEDLRPTIEKLGMSLTTIHEHSNANIQWNRFTWLGHLREADIIIVPANWKVQPAKSNNRLTQAMSLGKPVICSPMPAYLKVAESHPDSFLIADTVEEWEKALIQLRDDQEFRLAMGKRALEASKDYSIDVIAKKWLDVFASDPDCVDIVIPTYKNLRGLKLCLESIRNCVGIPHKIFVVNNGSDEQLHQYLSTQDDITYIKKDKLNFAQAVNIGIRAGKYKYVLILNDDTILSRNSLETMVKACEVGVGGVNPLSNCDFGWRHTHDIEIGGVRLQPGINTFEQIEPIVEQIHDYKSPYREFVERDWLAFYCTLIPRKVIDTVGVLCEDYCNSGEDYDLCMRINRKGYKMVHANAAFVFHMGAVSRKILEEEDPGSFHKSDGATRVLMHTMWGKESVMLFSGPSWEKWDYRNLKTGIGGSEIWQIQLSRKLSDLGYRVISFCDCKESSFDGSVEWKPYTDYNKWVDEHWVDYAIISRTTDPLHLPLRAEKIFVQIHDVWLLSPKDQLFLDKVDKFCVLSDWHKEFVKGHHQIPDDKLVLTANGIEFDRFDELNVERDPFRLIWTSSLDRGLDNVLYMWPFIKEKVPEATLHVFYGLYNWKESAKRRNDTEGLKKIEALEKSLDQPGVFFEDRVSQDRLALEFKKSSLWLYPSWFSETFCISAIEAQRAGVPVIANKYAGLITTLGDSALLLGNGDAWWPYSKEGREAFIAETVSILTDRTKWEYWSTKGFENSNKYSWEKSALRWKDLFNVK